MKKQERATITKAVHDALMAEYNHKCAVCGEVRPQVHHINDDPSDNDPANLNPLCPNCHLIDQHNPTKPVDPAKLKLFRQYKDPAILTPQFEPLFRRLRFLDTIDPMIPEEELGWQCRDLTAFVAVLVMGDYYAPRIAEFTKPLNRFGVQFAGDAAMKDAKLKFHTQLAYVRAQIYFLAVELLRYQNWPLPKKLAHLSKP